jgi:ribosomal protein L37E
MGIIDTQTITLTCPQCGVAENSRIRDKGNGYSGSWWEMPAFSKCEVQISGSRETDFTVAGQCRKCGVNARAESRYNT